MLRRKWIPVNLLVAIAGAGFWLVAEPSESQPPSAASATAPIAAASPAGPAPEPMPAVGSRVPPPASATLLMAVRSELALPPLKAGEYAWNDEGAPVEGETVIVVNLATQLLSVYRGGYEIGRSSIIYGADNKPTPIGTFPIIEKKKDHISNLYGAPMPFMLRLTRDGIAIHGSVVEDGTATHGCIGIPNEFAALLFRAAKLGDRVLIAEGRMRRSS
jgi:lipoprotein-anchoring transpeptidase ErfK/SrfK